MSKQEYKTYDFRQAGAADDSANAFRIWITKASQVFAEHWASIANSDVSLTTTDIRTQSLDSAVEGVPATNLCCTFNITDEQTQSIWHVSQLDALRIVADLLDISPTTELEERPLTELEIELARTFFDLLGRSLRQGWLGNQPISCGLETVSTNPKRVRLCRNKDLVITSSLLIQLTRGEVTIYWVSKKQEMSNLLEIVTERRTPLGSKSSPQEVVEMLPLEIVGLLGQADVPMRRLASIAVGDILKLNQKIDQPVVASIDGRPFFKCWPGKIGETVGLEISNCLVPPAN